MKKNDQVVESVESYSGRNSQNKLRRITHLQGKYINISLRKYCIIASVEINASKKEEGAAK